eukprot:comp22381_c0_seq1/m.33370 comp22381_c0_seq1/g.33370  ORF comp22381_c0_seq1/g.33370 comp22381_c0_seq1/m.33370 type:complete len:246 (-) comp22381_c0_seq1:293-1030(-)
MASTATHPSDPVTYQKQKSLNTGDAADPPEHSNPETGENFLPDTKPGSRRTSALNFNEIVDSMKDVFGLKKKRKDSATQSAHGKIGEEEGHPDEKDGAEKSSSKPSSRKGSRVKDGDDFDDWGELYDKVQEWKEGDEGPAPEGKLKKQGTKSHEEAKASRASGVPEVKEVQEPKPRRASAFPSLFGGGVVPEKSVEKEVKRKITGENVRDDSFDDWGNLLDKVEQWKEEDVGKRNAAIAARKMRS